MKTIKISLIFTIALIIFNALNLFSQDVITGGTNSWVFHTPDDGRTSLFIAPFTNGDWDWNKQTVFNNDGSLILSGKLGIGTTDPTYKLDVIGNTRINNLVFGTALRFSASNYTSTNFDLNIDGNGQNPFLGFKNAANEFYILTLISNGNVGIGTTNPLYKLAVKGTIGCGELKVENVSAWPDFVFEADYNLMPLNELGTYVKQNKHLPEIPTTAEVQENGISVGEMNAKLLQKVEELTLYILQLENRIETLEKK